MLVLKHRTIVGHAPGPHLLITGGVHGDEFEPMLTTRRLLSELDPATLRGRLTVVPVVNEAAFARCDRVAEDQLDLARTCPGRDDGSITEQVAAALSRLIRSADAYIDLHTAGTRFAMLPLAGYQLHVDPQVRSRSREMARAFNLPIIWGTNPRLNGRSLSVARDAGIPAIYVENGGGGSFDLDRVEKNVRGCRGVLRQLGMLDEPAPSDAVRFVVEDDRDSSGFLQVQHPAPVEGFFLPAVALGDYVEPGTLLGTIVDPLGEAPREVVAQGAGRVLFLRTFPSVRVNDPLCCLLPIRDPGEASYPREET